MKQEFVAGLVADARLRVADYTGVERMQEEVELRIAVQTGSGIALSNGLS